MDDYYRVLGVTEQSDDDGINRAYRRKCLESHPDKHSNNSKAVIKFQQIQEAYSVLGDTNKRAQYDRWKSSGIDVPFKAWLSKEVIIHWKADKEKAKLVGKTEKDLNEDTRNKFRDYKI